MRRPRVGIIGAGQLGRMMALAAYPLGIECRFVDTEADSPGGQIGPIRCAALDDLDALTAMAHEVDVVTFDIENVSVTALEALTKIVPVQPNPAIVALAQDRLAEKQLFESLSIPTARYVAIDSEADLARAARELGWPIVLKARRLGYDGRGQRIVGGEAELAAAYEDLGRLPSIAEAWVEFERELSLIGVRGSDAQTRFYPLSENVHRDGILESSIAPYDDKALQASAEASMTEMMQRHDYTGILTIEFFATADGLVANEIAPRVHNSGHWTIEGAATSQFENHIRAILGLPLGSTAVRGVAAMRNLIGRMPARPSLLAIEGAHLHDYGKSARPGRKLGHVTLLAASKHEAVERLAAVAKAVDSASG
ncbi:MAG: 5-(carboxyamino)imidazole ribonucleotide synthase [Gammaproteobacteria bacterium]|nr:5-(carboxyamino)imidazole ribonucleotide synthase [Gammaproteobacteria bacterium]